MRSLAAADLTTADVDAIVFHSRVISEMQNITILVNFLLGNLEALGLDRAVFSISLGTFGEEANIKFIQ